MRIKNLFNFIIKLINKILGIINSDLRIIPFKKYSRKDIIPSDMEKDFVEIYEKCKEYTLTSLQRLYCLYNATLFISKHHIPGDIVECGVWKGGSMMLSALTLLKLKDTERKIYLYDTYEGMTEPSHHDVRAYDNFIAKIKYDKLKRKGIKWDYASLNEVKKNLISTGYPKINLAFIKGKVEETIPQTIPKKISILRLDTDWYESTYHELQHLFPLLSKNGILIVDDYGHWKGAKLATDKYIKENNINIFLNRIDNTGRLGIKLNY
jgi:hypothetical protein